MLPRALLAAAALAAPQAARAMLPGADGTERVHALGVPSTAPSSAASAAAQPPMLRAGPLPVSFPATGYKQLTNGVPIQDQATAPLGTPWAVYNYYIYGAPAGVPFKVRRRQSNPGFCGVLAPLRLAARRSSNGGRAGRPTAAGRMRPAACPWARRSRGTRRIRARGATVPLTRDDETPCPVV
jgi:hypothetical protein